jgi:flavin-dependent dehydrogenase
MRVAIVGAGPTGLYAAMALARRGHAVTVVDRDAGPGPDARWDRRGVMQFHHPHAFRQQTVDALRAEVPEVLAALLDAGAEPVTRPGRTEVAGLRCRRLTFERVLRTAAESEPGVSVRPGHAEAVLSSRGRAVGVSVDGAQLSADLVIDASGRAGRLGRDFRAPAESSDSGLAYVSRQYRLRDGAGFGPMNAPVGLAVDYPGYMVIVFPHDNRVFSTLIARASGDRDFAATRYPAAYEAAAAAIPGLADWIDPDRALPFTPVLPGGRLLNSYQGQLDPHGRIALPGLIFLGDAVCTTNPVAGRGVSTSLMQVRQLLALYDEPGADHEACALAFDAWCTAAIRPWYADHVDCDTQRARRWAGAAVDVSRRLPSDLIAAAAAADPALAPAAVAYQTMHALPASLDAVEARARELYAGGWRPAVPAGPSRDELAGIIAAAAAIPAAGAAPL